MRAPRLLLALPLALAGCIDFQPLEPPRDDDFGRPSLPVQYHAALFVDRPATGNAPEAERLNVHLVLSPGSRAGALPLPDTLWVLGRPVLSQGVEPQGGRTYTGSISLPARAEERAVVELRPPRVGGVAPPLEVLRQGMPARLGGESVTLAPGADLELRLDPATLLSDPAPRDQGWALELHWPGRSVTFNGQGPPPERLVVPGSLLPSAAGSEVAASLTLFRSGSYGDRAGDYSVDVHLNARIAWRVRVAQR